MLNQNRKRRTNTRYSRGRQYPLKGLVLCTCGNHMTPKGATGRVGPCFYYECSRQIHQQSQIECSSPRIPAVALEEGVKGLLRRIGTSPQAREQIVRHAMDALGEDAIKLKDEATLVRNRLAGVNGEINNLVNVLAKMGADAADLVKEGLARLKGSGSIFRASSRNWTWQRLRTTSSASRRQSSSRTGPTSGNSSTTPTSLSRGSSSSTSSTRSS
jgi:hypothetical protein